MDILKEINEHVFALDLKVGERIIFAICSWGHNDSSVILTRLDRILYSVDMDGETN